MSRLIVCMATLSSGGAERVLSNLSKPLADVFDSVTYVMWVGNSVFYQVDSRVKLLSIQKEIDSESEIKRMLWFRQFVKQDKPNLILSFLEPINLRVLMCTIGLGIKTVVAERNDPYGVNKFWVMEQLEKLIYLRADMILVQTETIRKFFNGVLAKRTRVIYNPVNLPENMVGKALVTPKKHRIVSVARLIPQKKHDVLIRAFKRFSEEHHDYTLTIYGTGSQYDELENLISALGLANKVFMPGTSKKVHQEILDAEMFCLVSTREGMSNSMIEAMCLGLPCICTKVSGAIDLINHGHNGFLVEIEDEQALYEQMSRVANDKLHAESIGKEAAQLYNILRMDKISKQWTDCLVELVNLNIVKNNEIVEK